ncbi:MAG: isovaleryl-CoA dehydrogenase [Calditrichaeota bacterium]|nr:MAG: isovaleryl-CoA dehydrogenase [Calditrichota bacterium]
MPTFPETHEVINQPPPLEGLNLYESDQALREAVHREQGGWAEPQLAEYGALAGGEMMELGFQANRYPPVLQAYDRFGHRIDEVEYHPAYHRLMEIGVSRGIHSLPWSEPRPGAHVARAAMMYLHVQAEAGTACPLSMMFAGIPTLRHQPEVAEWWMPRVLSREYDPRNLPADQKAGITLGMALTEKQGGSDVQANTTRAYPLGTPGPGQSYALVGHKWFCSAPMSDAFLVTARTEQGLCCFLMPRWKPEGTRNAFHILRLKDKLGNRANASGEVEFRGACAIMIGPEGKGVRTIIEMVAMTRFDCLVASAGVMRQALVQALHHCAHRQAFGKLLIDQPLMQNVLADLAVETEAALALGMRVARALDAAEAGESERLFLRLAIPVGKYWVCKRTPVLVGEALECLGGNGYVEESLLPRLYREAPLNSIWEGSGNVQCLDVLRAISRSPEALDAFIEEIRQGQGANRRLDAYVTEVENELADREQWEYRARRLVERMAIALQATLLVRHAPAAVADAFCASRLEENVGRAFGTLPRRADVRAILERARPAH